MKTGKLKKNLYCLDMECGKGDIISTDELEYVGKVGDIVDWSENDQMWINENGDFIEAKWVEVLK